MPYPLLSKSRTFICVLTTFFLLSALISAVHAKAPMAKTQAPGYYRMMVGQFEITALSDGYTSLKSSLLRNLAETEIQHLLSSMFINGDNMETSVNGYLINTGSRLVLVDTGAAGLFGKTLGNLLKNLKSSGYEPSQVDAVLITHLHGDHIGGLLDDAGRPAFANATVYLSKAENDFFLSSEIDKFPSDKQFYFKMARDIAAPYIALGRWKTFDSSELPMPGIKAVAIPGHTPGHTAFEVESGEESILIWGDLIHSMAVQFSKPDTSIEFDVDQKQAIATRTTLLKDLSSRTLIAGMHLPFPGIGKVQMHGDGSYSWIPINFFQLR